MAAIRNDRREVLEYALHLREMVAREERSESPRIQRQSWLDLKRMLLAWADDLEQEAKEAARDQT